MSASFKVQKLSTANNLAKTKSINKNQQNTNSSSLGQISFAIPSLSILTYSSHALIQILSCFFDNDSDLPAYAQVQKALQILSEPITDDILKSDLNSLILKNIHKKKDVYVFFCLWNQYLSIQQILQRISDKKLQQKVLYTILVTYLSDCTKNVVWYESLAMVNSIKSLLQMEVLQKNSRILEEIDAQITNLFVENHNHFQKVLTKLIKIVKISSNLPISNLVKKLPINFLKNKNNQQFIDQMNQNSLLSVQSRKVSKEQYSSIIEYITQNDLKEVRQIFEKSLLTKVQNKFNSEKNHVFFQFVQSIFGNTKGNLIASFLKSSIKNLFVTTKTQNLWKFFEENFTLYKFFVSSDESATIQEKREFLMKFMNELSKEDQKIQKRVQKMLYSKYINQFLEGRAFNFPQQLNFLQRKSGIKFEQQREVISKCIKHIKNQKFLNIMTFNKSSFPESIEWPISISLKQLVKKYESIDMLKRVLSRVKQYWEKVEQEMLKENRKIELLFSVLRIQIDQKPICVTFQQFEQILKNFSQTKNIDIQPLTAINYRSQYSPVTSDQQQKLSKSIVVQKDQEIHPIIIEAKIIKLMKKQLKKATVQEISNALNLNPQKTHQTVKKLVTKGYLQEHQDDTYSYEA